MKHIVFAVLAIAMLSMFSAPSLAIVGKGNGADNAHGANNNNAQNNGKGSGNSSDKNVLAGGDTDRF